MNVRCELTTTASDEELVARYRESRVDAALEELVRRHVPRVRVMIFQMVLEDSAADDLTQETMLRAIRSLASFQGRAQFSTWLYRIAMNTTHSFLDRQNRSPVVFQAELVDNGSQDFAPDREATRAELLAQVEAAIAALSPKLRAAMVLTALQGLGPREAAQIENCSEATIHSRVHEARKQLRHKLRGYLS